MDGEINLQKVSIGLRLGLAAMFAGVCLLPTSDALAEAPQAEMSGSGNAAIDVLLLGCYTWAEPEYVALCKKEGINLYGPMRKDPTGADPANNPLEYLKQFHVVVASGPLEKPWDPQVEGGGTHIFGV